MSDNLIKENAWSPIKLGHGKAYNISSYAVSSSWYNKNIENHGTRLARLRRYHEADCGSVEIARALDIMAEDVSSMNGDNEEIFYNEYLEEDKIKKTTLNIMNDMRELWEERTQMEETLFERVRKTLKYGATFYRKQSDGSLKELPTEKMVGYVLSEEDDTRVTHYIYKESEQFIEDCNKTNFRKKLQTTNESLETIPVNDLVVFKIGDEPFGKSVIERVYSTWKKLSMIEDSIVIYRVVRSPERRIYYIDTGNLQGPKREAAIEKQRLRLKQKQASKGGNLTTDYDPHSTSEDIFIPTNSQGKGSRVETLPAGQNLGEMNDLIWFHKQLAAGLRIPFSMIDVASPESERNTYNDMRVGQIYQIEMRYVGHIKRLQRYFQKPCNENFKEFLQYRNIVPVYGMKLRIMEPSSFAMYKEMEVNQTLLNVAGSTQAFPAISSKTVMQKYLKWEQEDIIQNELNKLKQVGFTDEQIKEMPESDIDNVVYSREPNPAILEKYGLKPQEGGFGGY